MVYYVTEGECSDFGVWGVYEGPPGVDVDALVREFKLTTPPARVWEPSGVPWWRAEDFIAFAVERAGLKPVEATELYIESLYGHPEDAR